ncbi:MAG TPA: helix-turn-helix domain-containing protein [Kofleriaceae bacterium]|nr:helix-turn-helix domain-containing protein [Kofleriaceae bacterium]
MTRASAKRPRRARRTYHHGDLRRALVDAAVAIIAEQGAEAFTLREAARRLGVNHRAAYRHFADKAALLAAVAEQGFRGLIETTQAEAASVTGPAQRLAAAARAYVAFAAAHPAHFRVMFGPRLNEGAERKRRKSSSPFVTVDALVEEAYRMLEAQVREGMAAGIFANDPGPHPVIALWAAMHGLASLVLMKRVDVPPGKLAAWVDRIFDRALRGLR